MSVIGIDVDGVLASFNQGYVDIIKRVTGKDNFGPDFHEGMITKWEYPQELFGYLNEDIGEVWETIKNDRTFWFNLAILPNAWDFAVSIEYALYDHDIYFITSRPGKTSKQQTELWLSKKLDIEKPTVLISSEKGLCARALKLDYYIDDRTENCIDVMMNSKTKCYMLKQPWNTEIKGVPRIDSLNEFVEVVKNG